MVTMLRSDDPEMTTPKANRVFFSYPKKLLELVKLFSSNLPWAKRVLFFFLLLLCLQVSWLLSYLGQRCGPLAQSAGFLRDYYSHGPYL